MKFSISLARIWAVILLLSGCAGGTWPNLSDPLPDPASRERVVERAQPAPDRRVPDSLPASTAEAEALLQDIRDTVQNERQTYQDTLNGLQNSPAGEAAILAWNGAQLALTRVSNSASRLEPLMALTEPAFNKTARAAKSLFDEVDGFVVAERQKLFASRPQ